MVLVVLVPACHCALVGILGVQNIFFCVFCGSIVFSRGYVVGPKVSLMGNFVIFSCWPHDKKWSRTISQVMHSIPSQFQ